MTKNTQTVGIYTLGCKVNQYESEAIAEELLKNGLSIDSPSSACDAYIINTCTVTAESDRKARQFIRRAISKNPDAYVVVTGCFAQVSPESIAAIEGVDAVIGNGNKLEAAKAVIDMLKDGKKKSSSVISVKDINNSPFEPMQISSFERTRAYVKIEDGCENRCTYCIIPSARGRVRSKPMDEVLYEVRTLTENGCREIVLTGIETASYGKDLEDTDLATLLEAVDKIEGIGRVRLGSLDPSLIKPDFVKRISALKSLAPHFHLSLQSGSDRILAKMKRKYNSTQAMRAIELLRENIKDVKFTTDVIVGFPTESEDDFMQSVDFVRRARFLMVHVFPYSSRKGTPACSMQGQVSGEEKTRRVHVLSKAAQATRKTLLDEICERAEEREVLFETFEDGYAYGHSPDFLEVAVKSDTPLHAIIKKVRLTYTDGNICFGEIVE
jgi:threonylcarbamoyladenosine tRNA methylthiotransferase MtaB